VDAADFDFWLGSWVCTDPTDGSVGTNVLARVLSGRVIEETFQITDASGDTLNGRSWTVLDPVRGWCQTWVDDHGGYLDFTGGPDGDDRLLSRPGQRMVFRDITDQTFTWDWEKEGPDRQWTLVWRLFYRRA
jgi:hypothetical protein